MCRYDPTFLVMAQAVDDVERIHPRLDGVEAQAVGYVLSQGVHRLGMLQSDGGPAWEEYSSMEVRMNRPVKLEPPEDVQSDRTLFVKRLRSLCSLAQHVLKATAQELYFHRTNYYLEYALHVENAKRYDEIVLKTEHNEVNEQVQNFTQQLSALKQNFNQTSFYLSDHMIGPCLRKAVANAWANAQTVMKHAEKTLQSEISQKNYELKQREDFLLGQIDDYAAKMQDDSVIDVEIDNQLLMMISKLTENLEKWTARYNSEIESLDVSLLQVSSKVSGQREELEGLWGEYRERQEVVERLRGEAEDREAEEDMRRRQNKAAARIQSWWRAVLLLRYVRARRSLTWKHRQEKTGQAGKKGKKK